MKELDDYFFQHHIPYIRYSDDIIVFSDTKQEIEEYAEMIRSCLEKNFLSVNPQKEVYREPGEAWEFLGFRYCEKEVDISRIAIDKMKKKMKRKARALYRWKLRKNAATAQAVSAFIRHFHKKFYDNPIHSEITWARWYFPIINTDKSLHELDCYMQDCIRYIAAGNYSKKRFDFRYEQMKALGYTTLVNKYYSFLANENSDK